MKKIFFIIIPIIIVLIIIIFATKDFIAKQIIISSFNKKLDLNSSIGEVKLGLLETNINIKNFQVFNPQGFSKRIMIKIPQLFIDYDMLALLNNKVHFKKLKIYLEEFLVEKNKVGRVNIKTIKLAETKTSKKIPSQLKKEDKKEKNSINLKIDKMHLIIDRIIYSDMTSDEEKRGIFNINLDKKFKDITSMNQLRKLIITQVAFPLALDKIKNLNLEDIKDNIKKKSQHIEKQLKNLEDTAKDIKDIIENLPF